MNKPDLAFMNAADQADLIAKKEISPVDLVELYLERIEKWNPILHAYVTVCADKARAAAKKAEAEIAQGNYKGPLHGLPYGVKDQMATKGILTSAGSKIFSDNIPDYDATIIKKLDAAGAILIGKHNLHEFGKGVTVNFPYGHPRNPWNLEHTASSSSTGSGISMAAGLCSLAIGEDTGGSIRGPASATGTVGIRPTYGRVSRHGGMMWAYTNDTFGPMTRTVKDCALVLQTIAGHDPKDELSSGRPVPDYTEGLTKDLKGIELAVVKEMTRHDAVHPDVTAAIDTAIEVLKKLGATVEEISLPYAKYAVPLQMLTSDADVSAIVLHKWLRTHWHDFDSANRIRFAAGALIPAPVYSMAMRARHIVRKQILAAMKSYDGLICPTNPSPPAKIEEARETANSIEETNRKIELRRIGIYPFSLANVPTIAVPMGFSKNGLPVSLQIGGKSFDEATVFRIAHAYEQATPWHSHHPDMEKLTA